MCCDEDFNSAFARVSFCLSNGCLKGDFLDIYPTTFLESVISKLQNLWGSYFVSKWLKFNLKLKKAARNREKVLCFWDNCIWIRAAKLCLLRTGYFSSAANVLTSSPNIWHVNNRNFFQLNWLFSNQSIG